MYVSGALRNVMLKINPTKLGQYKPVSGLTAKLAKICVVNHTLDKSFGSMNTAGGRILSTPDNIAKLKSAGIAPSDEKRALDYVLLTDSQRSNFKVINKAPFSSPMAVSDAQTALKESFSTYQADSRVDKAVGTFLQKKMVSCKKYKQRLALEMRWDAKINNVPSAKDMQKSLTTAITVMEGLRCKPEHVTKAVKTVVEAAKEGPHLLDSKAGRELLMALQEDPFRYEMTTNIQKLKNFLVNINKESHPEIIPLRKGLDICKTADVVKMNAKLLHHENSVLLPAEVCHVVGRVRTAGSRKDAERAKGEVDKWLGFNAQLRKVAMKVARAQPGAEHELRVLMYAGAPSGPVLAALDKCKAESTVENWNQLNSVISVSDAENAMAEELLRTKPEEALTDEDKQRLSAIDKSRKVNEQVKNWVQFHISNVEEWDESDELARFLINHRFLPETLYEQAQQLLNATSGERESMWETQDKSAGNIEEALREASGLSRKLLDTLFKEGVPERITKAFWQYYELRQSSDGETYSLAVPLLDMVSQLDAVRAALISSSNPAVYRALQTLEGVLETDRSEWNKDDRREIRDAQQALSNALKEANNAPREVVMEAQALALARYRPYQKEQEKMAIKEAEKKLIDATLNWTHDDVIDQEFYTKIANGEGLTHREKNEWDVNLESALSGALAYANNAPREVKTAATELSVLKKRSNQGEQVEKDIEKAGKKLIDATLKWKQAEVINPELYKRIQTQEILSEKGKREWNNAVTLTLRKVSKVIKNGSVPEEVTTAQQALLFARQSSYQDKQIKKNIKEAENKLIEATQKWKKGVDEALSNAGLEPQELPEYLRKLVSATMFKDLEIYENLKSQRQIPVQDMPETESLQLRAIGGGGRPTRSPDFQLRSSITRRDSSSVWEDSDDAESFISEHDQQSASHQSQKNGSLQKSNPSLTNLKENNGYTETFIHDLSERISQQEPLYAEVNKPKPEPEPEPEPEPTSAMSPDSHSQRSDNKTVQKPVIDDHHTISDSGSSGEYSWAYGEWSDENIRDSQSHFGSAFNQSNVETVFHISNVQTREREISDERHTSTENPNKKTLQFKNWDSNVQNTGVNNVYAKINDRALSKLLEDIDKLDLAEIQLLWDLLMQDEKIKPYVASLQNQTPEHVENPLGVV